MRIYFFTRTREEACMDELYREYSKIVYHFLLSLCHDAQLAEELTQETFLQAFLSLDRFDNSCKVSVWLCQIAKHLFYQHLRKTRRERAEIGPFRIPLNETGPYLEKGLIIMAVIQICIFILSNILIFRGYRIHKSIYGLTLTSVWLAAGYICALHHMSTVATLYRLLSVMTVRLVAEGIVFSTAANIFAKKVLH